MKCTEIEKRIDSFIADELDVAEKQKINLHLQECAACRKEVKEIQETSGLLKALPAVPVSNQFDARMMQAFRERQQKKAKPTFWEALSAAFSISKPALVLGLLAIAALTGFAFQLGRMTAPETGNNELSVNKPSEQKEETVVQIVEKRVEVPVIKTVEVPVYKEKIVNRVIYKMPKQRKSVKALNKNQNPVLIYDNNSQTAVSGFVNDEEDFSRINLKEFQPVLEIKTHITKKKDGNNEK